MTMLRPTIFAVSLLAGVATTAAAQAPAAHAAAQPEVRWGPAPAVFPAGAQMAVLQGDPSKAELFTVRLRMPNGYRIAPHTHPTDEHVTVISGALHVGMGTTVDPTHMLELSAGGFITAPAEHPHSVRAEGPTVVQVHGMGPFALTYVNPAASPVAARR
jgi:quercetin dioxygenase-like cupin family protein